MGVIRNRTAAVLQTHHNLPCQQEGSLPSPFYKRKRHREQQHVHSFQKRSRRLCEACLLCLCNLGSLRCDSDKINNWSQPEPRQNRTWFLAGQDDTVVTFADCGYSSETSTATKSIGAHRRTADIPPASPTTIKTTGICTHPQDWWYSDLVRCVLGEYHLGSLSLECSSNGWPRMS